MFVAGQDLIHHFFTPLNLLLLCGRDSCHPAEVTEGSPGALGLMRVPPDTLGQCDPVVDGINDLTKLI